MAATPISSNEHQSLTAVTKYDFKAAGLGERKNELLMEVLNRARMLSFDLLREQARQKADVVDFALSTRQESLEQISSKASGSLGENLKSAALNAGGALLLAWLVSGMVFMAYVAWTSGLSNLGIAFVALPAVAVASFACLAFGVIALECFEILKKTFEATLGSGYDHEKEAEIAYVAAAVWLFGRDGIYMRSGRRHGNGFRSKNQWIPEIGFVQYFDITSIKVDPKRKSILISDGKCQFAIEDDGGDVLRVAGMIVHRARAAGHDIPHMTICGDRMAGIAEKITSEKLARFAQVHPGVHVEARNGVMEACLLVLMKVADEVVMASRIADFEGIPVHYLVETRIQNEPDIKVKSARPVLH